MAFTVHPVGSASGFSEESQLDSELHRLLHAFGGRTANYVISPFGNNHFNATNPSGTDIQIAAGDAIIGGHIIRMDTAETRTLNTSVTSEVFLVVDDAKTGNAAIVAQDKATTDPTGQYVVKLWEATTDSSTITGFTDFRPYIPFPEDDPDESITGFKTGTTGTIAVDTTGVKTVSVTFPNSYRKRIDTATVTLRNLSDTGVDFRWWRTKNLTVDGFTVEANVGSAGASGSTADFDYQANGI